MSWFLREPGFHSLSLQMDTEKLRMVGDKTFRLTFFFFGSFPEALRKRNAITELSPLFITGFRDHAHPQ